jgi:hypothetical protein
MPIDIAFLLRHPLYLRLYEQPLRALAADGHRLHLVFRRLEKDIETTLLEDLKATYPNVTSEEIDGRHGWWWPLADLTRSVRDYARYHEPAYAKAGALTARARRLLPPEFAEELDRRRLLSRRPTRRLADALCRGLERLVPPDPSCAKKLARWKPDLLVVTPMVDFNFIQVDFAKAARAAGIPTVLAVASWDNLSNKGLVHVAPERTVLWNAIQREEAVRMHRLDRKRIVCTGAQPFDHWFEMAPGTSRAAFCAQVGGLDPDKPIMLYLCSSAFICRDEVSFVREWLAAVRASDDPQVRTANVLIRPHPSNVIQWRDAEFEDPQVAVWPRGGAQVVDAARKQAYFDSLHHAALIVGINTSGFIEAGIVGRRTLTLATEHFADTQEGTLHFHYLVEGGLLTVARSFPEHVRQVSETLADPGRAQAEVRAFIESFVRPAGLDQPATPKVVEAILGAAELPSQGWRPLPLAGLLRPAARRLLAPLRELQVGKGRGRAWRDLEMVTRPQILRPKRAGAPDDPAAALADADAQLYAALSGIAASEEAVIVPAWRGPPELEALYWVPFLRWMRQVCNLEAERLFVTTPTLSAEWFAEITANVLPLTSEPREKRDAKAARWAFGLKSATVFSSEPAVRLAGLYRDGVIAPSSWLGYARYASARDDGSCAGPCDGAPRVLLDATGFSSDELVPLEGCAAVRAGTLGILGGETVASPGPAEARRLARQAEIVVGPLGPAVVAAAEAGRSVHLLSGKGRAAACDAALLCQVAEETGGSFHRHPLEGAAGLVPLLCGTLDNTEVRPERTDSE